jgi:hypothetical protein
MWPTSDCLGAQGPLGCVLFLLKTPPRIPRQPVVGRIKKEVWPSGRFIAFYLLCISSIGSSGAAGCRQVKKRVFKNRFQSNSNRFKLLLQQQPPLLQLRLTILTKQGCEQECTQDW